MILKMKCSKEPISWHYSDGIEDLHYDILLKNNEIFKKHQNQANRVILINDNHDDYHSINIIRTNRAGVEIQEWLITDSLVFLLNDEGNTIDRIR